MSISPTKGLLKQEDKLYSYFKKLLSEEDFKLLIDLVEIGIELESRSNE